MAAACGRLMTVLQVTPVTWIILGACGRWLILSCQNMAWLQRCKATCHADHDAWLH